MQHLAVRAVPDDAVTDYLFDQTTFSNHKKNQIDILKSGFPMF